MKKAGFTRSAMDEWPVGTLNRLERAVTWAEKACGTETGGVYVKGVTQKHDVGCKEGRVGTN